MTNIELQRLTQDGKHRHIILYGHPYYTVFPNQKNNVHLIDVPDGDVISVLRQIAQDGGYWELLADGSFIFTAWPVACVKVVAGPRPTPTVMIQNRF